MSKYTPTFLKDGDTYIVPSVKMVYDTLEDAIAGGITAALVAGYGLASSGEAIELDLEHGYAGPHIRANVGNLEAWIIGGPTLDGLVSQRHDGVTNLPAEDVLPIVVAEIAAVEAIGDTAGDPFVASDPPYSPGPDFGGAGEPI